MEIRESSKLGELSTLIRKKTSEANLCDDDQMVPGSLQWTISSLLNDSLQELSKRERVALEELLTREFGWRDATFKFVLTPSSLRYLANDIKEMARFEFTKFSDARSGRNGNFASFTWQPRFSTPNNCPPDTRKSFFEFLTDFPLSQQLTNSLEDCKRGLLRRLRHRLDLDHPLDSYDEYASLFSNEQSCSEDSSRQNNAPYTTLLRLLTDYDPTGVCEIFQLLIDSKFVIPLFNPLTNEDYQTLLKHIYVQVAPNEPPITLGGDVCLPRIVIRSRRERHESQSSELLYKLFHAKNFRITEHSTQDNDFFTIDIGVGFFEKGNFQHHVLVALLNGESESAFDFIEQFADFLIIEDVSTADKGESLDPPNRKSGGHISKRFETLVWKPEVHRCIYIKPDENFKKFGIRYHWFSGPIGDVLCAGIGEILRKRMCAIEGRARTSFEFLEWQPLTDKCSVFPALKTELKFAMTVKNVAEIRQQLILQRMFARQAHLEDQKYSYHKNDEQIGKKIEKCIKYRRDRTALVKKIPVLRLFYDLLSQQNRATRVITLRQLEQELNWRTEKELQSRKSQIGKYSREYASTLSSDCGTDPKQKVVDAKRTYAECRLHVEHLWRELSHMYVARPQVYAKLPKFAAQHLLDGFSVELLDGDANKINIEWIDAVLKELNAKINSKKLFVLSVIGCQSSGKSTLLNTMFGIKMRTSVGQCTRGIHMQLVPVEGRPQYDYVLVLDTEGMRSPDFYGAPGNERRDNQMATVSVLLADACMVVNNGEDDKAIKEVLPIVLMAYQGSQLAEQYGGRLSSMMFFVYNRIDTTQESKLKDIEDVLQRNLKDAQKVVERSCGTFFQSIVLNVSDSRDFCFLGNNMKSYSPPDNIPNPLFGSSVTEFREHIHNRVTAAGKWTGRTPIEIAHYIDKVRKCLRGASFNLTFSHVVEREMFSRLEEQFVAAERKLSDHYYTEFIKLQRSWFCNTTTTTEEGAPLCEELQNNLSKAAETFASALNEELNVLTNVKSCRKEWRIAFLERWHLYKSKQEQYWKGQIKSSYDGYFYYSQEVERLKSELRNEIEKHFDEKNQSSPNKYDSESLRKQFDKIFDKFSRDVKDKYPKIDVKKCVDEAYEKSPQLRKIELRDAQEISLSDTPDQRSTYEFILKELTVRNSERVSTNFTQLEDISKKLVVCIAKIQDCVKSVASGLNCYNERVVLDVIGDAERILMENFDRIENSHRLIAHLYVRAYLTYHLQLIQTRWEAANSIPAKLTQQSCVDSMWQYFQLVSKGTKRLKLFGWIVKEKFLDLAKPFEAELVDCTLKKVREQKWLYDFKVTQQHMDHLLLTLIDRQQVSEIVRFVSEPEALFDTVFQSLIKGLIIDKEMSNLWESFINNIREAIKGATDDTVLKTVNRASYFLQSIRTHLLRRCTSDNLARSVDVQINNDFAELDIESDENFRKVCQHELIETVMNQTPFQQVNLVELCNRVMNQVIKTLREMNIVGAMPRCQASCPLCKSLCIREAGHDAKKLKHDAIHQPEGLGGVQFRESKCLSSQICSQNDDETRYWRIVDGKERNYYFRDWRKEHPEWEKPHVTQEWPLREYIFYNYHIEFANHYRCKPCVNLPESYNRQLDAIRQVLNSANTGR